MSAVPYMFNLEITRTAIAAGTHLCDLGGHTDVVLTQLALTDEAGQAGISVVPDCGMGPGLINTMTAFVVNKFDQPQEVYIYDGGLPQKPVPPWNYQLTFHINGLTNEMDGQAVFLRNGKITRVDTLSESEMIDFPLLGRLEADVTSGGTSTSPWTFEGRLKRLENRTLRYPGHFEWLRAFKALGLFSETPIDVEETSVTPRQVFHTLLEPKISAPQVHDVAAIRVVGKGLKNGRPARVNVDLLDYFDEKTGFTAMERLTGWHCAIMMGFQARGAIPAGCSPVETAVNPADFMAQIALRGIHFEVVEA
jgi:lysine 6-dehydrogenase